MSKINDIMQGRNEGMALALKIAQENGIDTLEKEVTDRGISGISLNVSRKEIREASMKVNIRATEVALAISLVTLMDEFYFSRSQMQRFDKAFNDKVMHAVNSERSTDILKEYTDRIREDTGIKISIKD